MLFNTNAPYYQKGYVHYKTLLPTAQRFVNNRFAVFKKTKEYKNGGKLYTHTLFDKSVHDAKDIQGIANMLAKDGKTVMINPTKLHYKDKLYNEVYKGLKDTHYYGKNPDLTIDGKFYEYESFETKNFQPKKIAAMLKHGAKQSDRIIINNKPNVGEGYIKWKIDEKVREGFYFKEVWTWNGKELVQVY